MDRRRGGSRHRGVAGGCGRHRQGRAGRGRGGYRRLARLRRAGRVRQGLRLGHRLRGEDRLQGERQDRRDLGRDGRADERGRFRPRHGVGRCVASRLVSGKRVQPVNVDLIPSWNKVDARLQNAPWHTVDGVHYGVPYQWGSNVLMYNTEVFKDGAPKSWNVVFEPMNLPDGKSNQGRVQAFDGPIYIADAALYLMKHQARTRHQGSVRADRGPVQGGARSAARAAQDRRPLLARRHGPDRRLQERGNCRIVLMAVPGEPAARPNRSRSPAPSRTKARPAGPTRR